MEWLSENRIKVTPPKRPKKITGTRFASIMGLNKWSTPFEIWCAVTRTYEKPFEDTIYTLAGKAIEPKQAEFIAKEFFWQKVITPKDVFGENYFEKTFGDFFPKVKVLGGMWDYLFADHTGSPTAVLEMKTTKRIEDWKDDVPEYYALQAALYAYLMGVDDVYMVCTVLTDKDYSKPEEFICTNDNTFTRHFKVSERYPDMENRVEFARQWFADYVESGISPPYDEKKDAEILKALRSVSLNPTTDISALVAEAEDLKSKLDAHKALAKDLESRYKTVTEMLKKHMQSVMKPGDVYTKLTGENREWTLTKRTATSVDADALKRDNLYEKYMITSESFALTSTTRKGDK